MSEARRPSITDGAARRARTAVTVLYAVNGLAYAAVVPFYPLLQQASRVSAAGWGVALTGYPIGTLAAGAGAAWLVRRWGSAWPVCAAIAMLGVTNTMFALVHDLSGLLAVFLVLGCLDGAIEVAASVQAVTVQRRYGRWLLHSCHVAWSAGAIAGGALGAVAAGVDAPLRGYLPVVAAGVAVAVACCRPHLLPDPRTANPPAGDYAAAGRRRSRPAWRRGGARGLLAAGLLAACGAYVEDVPASWGAIYLHSQGAAAGTAGAAVVAAQAAMAAGRAVGDRLSDRWGPRRVVQAGAGLVAAGMTVAVLWPSVAGTLAACAACGLGVAAAIPAAVDHAAGLPGQPTASAVTVVSMLQRIGPMASPVLIGLIADHAGLRAGLATVPVVAVLLWGLARVLSSRPAAGDPGGPASTTD